MKKIFPVILLFIFMCSLFAVAFSSVSVAGVIEDSWSEKSPMNHDRNGFEVVAVNNRIYVIGGYTGSGPYESEREDFKGINERYDPMTDTWVTLEAMPTPRCSFAIAEHQGKIYCMGGCPYVESGMKPRCNVNEVYDIATDSWSTKSDMPFVASGIHAQVIDGKIFVINGNAMFMYDPETDVWTNKPEVPLFLMPPVSAVVEGKIILTGNFPGMHYDLKIMIYDPKTDAWSNIRTGAIAVSNSAVAAETTTGRYVPKKAHVFFGDDTHLVYDPTSETWSTAEKPPTNISMYSIVVINDILYAIRNTVTMQYIPMGYNNITPKNLITLISRLSLLQTFSITTRHISKTGL